MTSKRPLFSVVIAAYNAASTISICIDSILEQTVDDLEIIVCDDASTDSTLSILESISDARIKIVSNASNGGAGYSRDRAISLASGEWIALMDADDAWSSHRLERLLWSFGGDHRELIFDDLLLCHDGPTLIPFARVHGPDGFDARGKPVDVDPARYITGRRLVASPIFTKRLVEETGAGHGRRRAGQDIDFRLALIASGAKLRYLPEAHYFYRMRPNSLSAQPTGPDYIRIFEDAAAIFIGNPVLAKAIETKSTRLRDKYEVVKRLREWKLLSAAGMAVRNPVAAWDIALNMRDLLRYEASRRRHGIARSRIS